MSRPSLFTYQPCDIENLSIGSLNADLDAVQRIVEKTHPERLRILLSTKATANYTHLQEFGIIIERTGTPLQMAIFGDDEGLQAFFKDHMHPAEYERQAIEAFSSVLPEEIKTKLARENASASDYQQAMVDQQQEDAGRLCAGLEAVMHASKPGEFTAPSPNYIADSRSEEVNAAIADFKKELLRYTQKNPVHNRYILLRLVEIYENLPPSFERDCFFSQKGFSAAQVLMPLRWLHHHAEGIYSITQNMTLLKNRSLICADSCSCVDIRSFLPRLSVGDCFLSLSAFSGGTGWPDRRAGGCMGVPEPFYKSCVEQKQNASQNLLRSGPQDQADQCGRAGA